MRIETIEFKRSKNAFWERGVSFDEGNGVLVDMKGQVVPVPIWDARPDHDFIITIPEKEISERKYRPARTV